MTEHEKCPQCGRDVPSGSPQNLCPACLLKRGLESNTLGQTRDTSRPAWTPPRPEELSASFPELEILELIGRGGMGAVYKVRQKELDRIAALKILPPEIGRDAGFAERFAREAQAMARLNHPSIVTIYNFGRSGEQYFFLMEYVDGLSLRQVLAGGGVSAKEALAIVPQICDALQYAHDRGIVHRDIKPENILMTRQGQVKIADFGLAKLVGSGAGATPVEKEKIMGTPQYMAPEQSERPGEVDHRADIYSLGVVFYQMLTGELPAGRFEPPSRKVLIDVRLDEVVLRAMEKEPSRRYQNVSEVKTQVETIVAAQVRPGEEIPAVKSRRKWFWKWILWPAIFLVAAAMVRIFVLGVYNAESDAVAPEITAGSRIFVYKLARTFNADDIITYDLNGKVMLARVASAGPTDGKLLVERFGRPPQSVASADVIGRVIFNTRADNDRQKWLISLVDDFFQHNYRDVTHRETIEWGAPRQVENGNWSISYKYLATIWDKDKLVIQDEFTFTPEGKFVAVKKLTQTPAAAASQAGGADTHPTENGSNVVITDKDFTVKPYPEGGLFTLTMSVLNSGRAACPSFTMRLYVNDPPHTKPEQIYTVGPISPGQVFYEASAPFGLQEGRNVIDVFLDPEHVIPFGSDTNRHAKIEIGFNKENYAKTGQFEKFSVNFLTDGLPAAGNGSAREGANESAAIAVAGLFLKAMMADDAKEMLPLAFSAPTAGAAPGQKGSPEKTIEQIRIKAPAFRELYRGHPDLPDRPTAGVMGTNAFVAYPLPDSVEKSLAVALTLEGNEWKVIDVSVTNTKDIHLSETVSIGQQCYGTMTGIYTTTATAGKAASSSPAITRDQIIVEDLAIEMLAAIRDKDDAALKNLACDRIPGWRDALPQFAIELRERFRHLTGQPLDLWPAESMVLGDVAAVKCTGPKELEGKYLVLFFYRTAGGWKNCSLRNSLPGISLADHLKRGFKYLKIPYPQPPATQP
jgi:serine/threonine protein kinase